MEIEQSIIIHRPVTQVFSFVSNPENTKSWQPEVIEHKMLSDGPMGLGSKMRHVSKFMGRRIEVNIDITEFVPNRKIAFQVVSGTLPYTICYVFGPDGNGTRFTYSAVMPNNFLLKLMQPLMMPNAKRVIDKDITRLKALLEKQVQ